MAAKKMFFVVLLALLMTSTSAVAIVHAQTEITIPTLNVDPLTFTVIIVVAMAGATVAAFEGWLASGEPFNAKKFSSSILHGVIGAGLFVVGYSFGTTVTYWDFLMIFLGTAGVDVLINRATGAIAQKAPSTTDPGKPLATTTQPGKDTSQTQTTPSAPQPPTKPQS
jgi:hypothetical protein